MKQNTHAREDATTVKLGFPSSNAFNSFLTDLAVLGVKPRENDGARFSVVGARSNDRYWLIPLSPRAATLAGFALFHPLNWRATLMKTAATVTARFVPSRIWARRTIALNVNSLKTEVFGQPVSHVAFFTGTDGPHRKTAIEFIGAEGSILGYAKVTRRSDIASYLRNEAEMLHQLNALGIKSADIPVCRAFETSASHTMLVTDSKKSRSSRTPRVMTSAHVDFLLEIATKTRHVADKAARRNFASWLRRVREGSTAAWQDRFDAGLRLLDRVDMPVQLGLAHADFTPWNCFLENGRLYVFDWEYANIAFPLGYDVMKFHTCQQGSTDAKSISARIVNTISGMFFGGNFSEARFHYRLSLLLHSAFYFERARNQEGNARPWAEAPQFAALFDSSLI